MSIAHFDDVSTQLISTGTWLYQQAFEATTGWTILGNDTANLTTDVAHVIGAKSLEFDKVDGDANTVFAGVYRTVDWDLSSVHPTDHLIAGINVDTADVTYALVRLGTSASHYTEWRYPDTGLGDSLWSMESVLIGEPSAQVGNGVLWNNIDYLVVAVAFDAAGDAVADIFWNYIGIQRSLLTRT